MLKNKRFLIITLITLALTGCANRYLLKSVDYPDKESVIKDIGVIRFSGLYCILDFNNRRFDPIDLPGDFKKDGLIVDFEVKYRPDIISDKNGIENLKMAEIIRINIPRGTKVEGFYSKGFEVSELIPKGINERWWVVFVNQQILRSFYEKYKSVTQKDYEPVYLKVYGVKSKLGKYGHMGTLNRVFVVEEIIEMRKKLPDDN